MPDKEYTIGLLVKKRVLHGYTDIFAQPVIRESGSAHPINPKYQSGIDALELRCFITDFDAGRRFYGDLINTGTNATTSTMERDLAIMKKIESAWRRADVQDVRDQVTVMAKVIGATWVCEKVDNGSRYESSSYADNSWLWHSVPYGALLMQTMCADALKVVKAREGQAA